MAVEGTAYYNYYNIKGRYSPKTPQIPSWKKEYAVTTDEVRSNNRSQDEDAYKAYSKLEDIYYSVSVRNREKYSNVDDLYTYLNEKYNSSSFNRYSYEEKKAMYFNELEMTLYGCLGGGGNVDDPHLSQKVCDPTDSEKQVYNRNMVNLQVRNILTNSGFDLSLLSQRSVVLKIDPFYYKLSVIGLEDTSISQQIEQVLNSSNNAKQLFYHILNSNASGISKDVLTKYRALKDFQNVTGLDLRDFFVTQDGFVNAAGENALELYKEYLKSSSAIPSEFKGVAYGHFAEQLGKLAKMDVSKILDLNLEIGLGEYGLYNVTDESIYVSRFDTMV
ncbi:MAG: DUF4885 family protein [Candidatus Galacturonibacter soehngenii]|nr:DUF4885 family protein [Candidatus Galacturonibacter soehngenii]